MATFADIEYLAELYMSLKRSILKNKFIRLPKNIDKFTQDISEVVDKIQALHADPIDFIKFMFRYFSPMRIIPSPRHLLSDKAVMKYRYHQALKNRYIYDDYTVDGDELLIHETLETVSYRNEIMLPPDKDLRLRTAIFLSTQKDYILSEKDKRDVVYAIAKLKFVGKPVPYELIKLKERITDHGTHSNM